MFSSLKLPALRARHGGPHATPRSSSQQDVTSLTGGVASKPPRTPLLTGRSRRSSRCGVDNALCVTLRPGPQRGQACQDPQEAYVMSGVLTSKADITLQRETDGGSLGFTLRGGSNIDQPLLVTNVRSGGPADRSGLLFTGDRLLAVNGTSIQGASLTDAHSLLRSAGISTTLTIEYDLNNVEALRSTGRPLRVELSHPANCKSLGLSLTDCVAGVGGIVVVTQVTPASLADRCGALKVGDQILAVGDTRIESSSMVASEVTELLYSETLILEILPLSQAGLMAWRERLLSNAMPSSPCPSGFSTLNSRHRSKQHGRVYRPSSDSNAHDSGSINSTNCIGVYHSEILYTTLHANEEGIGLSVQGTSNGDIIISEVVEGSPADRCGCIQVGDRLLSLNGRLVFVNQMSPEAVNRILQEASILSMQLEFDVADSIVATSGVFSVKLAKKGNGLGIIITASPNRITGDPLIISHIWRGSVAHRTGILQPGDRLLAIDNISLDQYSLEDTEQILQNSGDIVTLQILKEKKSDAKTVVYTIELDRLGGPLGITIAGSEEPFEPIRISGLTNGGMAQQTGALHIGDQLLAINGDSLCGKPLSEAIALLQNSSDVITLKIARNISRSPLPDIQENMMLCSMQFGSALPSVDSAVESWDSSMRGNTPTQPTPEGYHTESATIKRKHKDSLGMEPHPQWDNISQSTHSVDSGQSGVLSDEEKVQWSKGIESDLGLVKQSVNNGLNSLDFTHGRYSPPESPMPLPHYLRCNTSLPRRNNSFTAPQQDDIYQVTLFKDPVYEDFGFSVSDGLYERGVYINRIRKGGPADLCGVLKPYDQILQVNDTRTNDFDCCLTVPLIASAGEKLHLTISRNTYCAQNDAVITPWNEEEHSLPEYHTTGMITKTL